LSVLLINPTEDLGSALVSRLIGQDDEVRVIAEHVDAARKWTRLGAHVARGGAQDVDLIERAAQNVRTIVVLQEATAELGEIVEAAAHGGRLASAEMRLVVCLEQKLPAVEEVVRQSGLDYVLLRIGTSAARFVPLVGRRRARVPALVEAIDAADDLAGNPRLDLDLTTTEGWSALGLDPPQD
jgi:uncharacterized protein YbjT (DUF2867 family)